MPTSRKQWRPRSTHGDAAIACDWSKESQRSAVDAGDSGDNATTARTCINNIVQVMETIIQEVGSRLHGKNITHGRKMETSHPGKGHRVPDNVRTGRSRGRSIKEIKTMSTTTRARAKEEGQNNLLHPRNGFCRHLCQPVWSHRRFPPLRHLLRQWV